MATHLTSLPREPMLQYYRPATGDRGINKCVLMNELSSNNLSKKTIEFLKSHPSATWDGGTALHVAVEAKASHHIQLIVNLGINVNAHNNNGLTALHDACGGSDFESVNALLNAGCSPNTSSSNGATPLCIAVTFMDNPQIVKLLLSFNADPNLSTLNAQNAIKYAQSMGKIELLQQCILECRDQTGIKAEEKPASSLHLESPDSTAEKKLQKEQLKYLYRLDYQECTKKFDTLIRYYTPNDNTKSHLTRDLVRVGRLDLVYFMVCKYSGYIDWAEIVPELQQACRAHHNRQLIFNTKQKGDHLFKHVLAWSLKNGDIKQCVDIFHFLPPEHRQHALVLAVEHKRWDFFDAIIDKFDCAGVSFNLPNGEPFIFRLYRENQTERLQTLILHFDVLKDVVNQNQQSFLHLEMKQDTCEPSTFFSFLLSQKANVNQVDKDKKTPIFYGFEHKSPVVYRDLLKAKANYRHTQTDGRDFLYVIARQGRHDILLECEQCNIDWINHRHIANRVIYNLHNETPLKPDINVMAHFFTEKPCRITGFQKMLPKNLDIFQPDKYKKNVLCYLLEAGQLAIVKQQIEQCLATQKSTTLSPERARARLIYRAFPYSVDAYKQMSKQLARLKEAELMSFVWSEVMPIEMRSRPQSSPYQRMLLVSIDDSPNRIPYANGLLMKHPWMDIVTTKSKPVNEKIEYSWLRKTKRTTFENSKIIIDGHGPTILGCEGVDIALLFDHFFDEIGISKETKLKLSLLSCGMGEHCTAANFHLLMQDFLHTFTTLLQRPVTIIASSVIVYIFEDGETIATEQEPSTQHSQDPMSTPPKDRPSERVVKRWQGSSKWLDPNYKFYKCFTGITAENYHNELILEFSIKEGAYFHQPKQKDASLMQGIHSVAVQGDIVP